MKMQALVIILTALLGLAVAQSAIEVNEILADVPVCVSFHCFILGRVTRDCGGLLGLSGDPNLECFCKGSTGAENLTDLWFALRDCSRANCGQNGDDERGTNCFYVKKFVIDANELLEVTIWAQRLCNAYRRSGVTMTGSPPTTTFSIARSTLKFGTTSEAESTPSTSTLEDITTFTSDFVSPTTSPSISPTALDDVTDFIPPPNVGIDSSDQNRNIGIGVGISFGVLLLIAGIVLSILVNRYNAKKKATLPTHHRNPGGSSVTQHEMDGTGPLLVNTSLVEAAAPSKAELDGCASTPSPTVTATSPASSPRIAEKRIDIDGSRIIARPMSAELAGTVRPPNNANVSVLNTSSLSDEGAIRGIEMRAMTFPAAGQILEMDAGPDVQSRRGTRVSRAAEFSQNPLPRVLNEGVERDKPCDW